MLNRASPILALGLRRYPFGAAHAARPLASRDTKRLSQIQLLEEVIALVVDDDEGGKILHLDFAHRLHAELGILYRLDLLDAVFGKVRRRAADRGEIKAAVLLARF